MEQVRKLCFALLTITFVINSGEGRSFNGQCQPSLAHDGACYFRALETTQRKFNNARHRLEITEAGLRQFTLDQDVIIHVNSCLTSDGADTLLLEKNDVMKCVHQHLKKIVQNLQTIKQKPLFNGLDNHLQLGIQAMQSALIYHETMMRRLCIDFEEGTPSISRRDFISRASVYYKLKEMKMHMDILKSDMQLALCDTD